jgi:hypothetical protein
VRAQAKCPDRSTKIKKNRLTAALGGALAATLTAAIAAGCSPERPDGGGTDKASMHAGQAERPGGDSSFPPFTWTKDSECAICHSGQSGSLTDPKQPQAIAHASDNCVSCHTDVGGLASAHAGLSYDSKPTGKAALLTASQDACITCHGELQTVAVRTTDSTALKDSNGKVVNPHQRPDGNKHSENPALCTDCHKVHSEDLARDAMKYCASCHHRGVFECGTCHAVEE